ncbi:isochorismate synthase MenF [Halobacterium salinarum]|uniref:isochorismate synthase n=1 Tax=Halobacterium salinarum TaxID=2242 RepID=UPI001F4581C6|nr:isochorismate synthase MenF [Halobacterium salinarum]MCF2238171.1 isochorismate synthase MenF [Halobacterium salinarum]
MSSLAGETTADGPVVATSCRVADVSTRAFLAAHAEPGFHWADPDGLELSGAGTAASVTAAGGDRFAAVREWSTGLFADLTHDGPDAARPRLFGGFSFFDAHTAAGVWQGFPPARFVLPAIQLTSVGDETWLTAIEAGPDATAASASASLADARDAVDSLPAMQAAGPRPGVTDTTPTPGRDAWTAGVQDAVDRIQSGPLRKVVLATALRADLAEPATPCALLERLRQRYPACFRFLVAPADGGVFLGATPERLASLRGGRVETVALAGSVGRGDSPAADARLADRLRESDKLRHEQGVVVDTIARRLEGIGDVAVGDRDVRQLSTIQHLETPISAAVSADTHVLDVIETLHPTPAVNGLPPADALATIRDTETFDRGWYAAPIGWIDADGDGTFGVGLRSGVVDDDSVTLFAGNGIVGDSTPDAEWEEVQLKYRPVLDELQ